MRLEHTGKGRPGVVVGREDRPDAGVLREWDRLVEGTPGTDITQLSVWARVRSLERFSPTYLFARRRGSLLGGAQVLVRHVRGLGRIGYVAYGPVVAGCDEDRSEAGRALATALAQLAGVRMLFVQPPEEGADGRQALVSHGFRPSSAGIAPTGSVRLDLTRCESEILRQFPPRLRSWTRRWAREGVTVRLGDETDVPLLARLMHSAANTRGYTRPPRLEYLRHMYIELARTGHAAMFIGEARGVPVTADVVTMCGTTLRGRLSGFDRRGDGGRLLVPGAARWEIIRWAKRLGYEWLDFGGLSEHTLRDAVDRGVARCDSWPGADRAKMQYGGVPFRYPGPVELIQPRLVRHGFDAVNGCEWGRAMLHRVKVRLRSSRHRPAVIPFFAEEGAER
jgi:lipid II:glycine glycyltransferase (peptidoglycan interpeptide bridge formation enzyme)